MHKGHCRLEGSVVRYRHTGQPLFFIASSIFTIVRANVITTILQIKKASAEPIIQSPYHFVKGAFREAISQRTVQASQRR